VTSPFDLALDGNIRRLRQRLKEVDPRPVKGRVLRVTGTLVHASVPEARLGEVCRLRDPRTGTVIDSEIVGFADDFALLSPIGRLTGISTRTEAVPTGRVLEIPVGRGLLGRVLDAQGQPLDAAERGPLPAGRRVPVHADPPMPLARRLVGEPMPVGVRAIDGLLTCGRGQRVGIFGEPGSGKSSLIASIVKGAAAEISVVAMIGERGREVREFIERQLGPEGLVRSVLVVATSDRSAMERVKAAYVATAIAEHFRDQGSDVLLLMDSVTRFARAQREIGLAAGEPPTRRGFPPSIFAQLPRLLERSGPGQKGTITAFYTVLVEGDGAADPIAEEVRAILDGHIVLSAKLGRAQHFPAIDILESRSRVMDAIVDDTHRAAAAHLRALFARHAEIELLVRVGEYRPGSDPLADEALAKRAAIDAFLKQPAQKSSNFEETKGWLAKLTA
jgi:type III secretion protein N (ATPase)